MQWGALENVAALARTPRGSMTKKPTGPSNLDMACSALRSRANVFTHCWELGPRLFGSAQARARLWIGLLLLRALRDLQLTEKDASLWLNELMQRCVGGQRTDVHDYLSEETGPEVMAKYRKLIANHFASKGDERACILELGCPLSRSGRRGAKRARDKAMKWPEAHFRKFEVATGSGVLDWCTYQTPDEATLMAYPGLLEYTERQFQVLHLMGIRSFPEKTLRIVDLPQNLEFIDVSEHMPCVTPGGEKYLSTRCRSILAVEALRFQGIWLDEQLLSGFSEKLLMSLAGNAFETSCYAAVMWCLIVFMSRGAAERHCASQSSDHLDEVWV
jgi:hypothetical protein